jgi:hypothetical protein
MLECKGRCQTLATPLTSQRVDPLSLSPHPLTLPMPLPMPHLYPIAALVAVEPHLSLLPPAFLPPSTRRPPRPLPLVGVCLSFGQKDLYRDAGAAGHYGGDGPVPREAEGGFTWFSNSGFSAFRITHFLSRFSFNGSDFASLSRLRFYIDLTATPTTCR